MAEKIRELIREYREGQITRRALMRRAVTIAGSLAGAEAIIHGVMPSRSGAAQVDPRDPALVAREVEYKGRAGALFGYLARPASAGKYPGITEEAMKAHGRSYAYKIYPGAQHGFHTDTNAERYHPEAAKEAWDRTIDFFKKHLQG